jgi:hypothetical protein
MLTKKNPRKHGAKVCSSYLLLSNDKSQNDSWNDYYHKFDFIVDFVQITLKDSILFNSTKNFLVASLITDWDLSIKWEKIFDLLKIELQLFFMRNIIIYTTEGRKILMTINLSDDFKV